jgi:hypothetical protein
MYGYTHILKYLDWEDHVKSRKASIREYLSKTNSGLKMFSVAQVIGKDPEECGGPIVKDKKFKI